MLTGATGSIGAHTLAQMLMNDKLDKVYCLVRGTDPLQRIFDSLAKRQLQVSPSQVSILSCSSWPSMVASPSIYRGKYWEIRRLTLWNFVESEDFRLCW